MSADPFDPFDPEPVEAPQKPAPATALEPLLVNAVTAAELLTISRTTLDKLVRQGKIKPVRLAGRVLFARSLLEAIARGEA
jgi:excisionase family DNA binding protein